MSDYMRRVDISEKAKAIPMGVVLRCSECGNRADSHWWYMSNGRCPNCLEEWDGTV